jgi:plasmid stabilization system protein ParE
VKYIVIWRPAAERDLVNAWLRAGNENALAAAANLVDQLLASDAHEKRESRERGHRVLFAPPLGVRFSVNVRLQEAYVLRVWDLTQGR